MSAETLRKAAALMRERANDAVLATGDEPWHFLNLGYDTSREALTYTVESKAGAHVAEATTEEQAEHIATWHPTVALAVADWLDLVAEDCEYDDSPAYVNAALAVARAYLGGS